MSDEAPTAIHGPAPINFRVLFQRLSRFVAVGAFIGVFIAAVTAPLGVEYVEDLDVLALTRHLRAAVALLAIGLLASLLDRWLRADEAAPSRDGT